MLLTIAIPTYNRADYLKLCLNSIKIQFEKSNSLYEKVDVIVLNNSSTDHTERVVIEFIKDNKFIKSKYVLNETNIGLDGNITKAFSLATGKFVVVFGDDDILIQGSLNKITSILENNPTCGNIYINSFAFKDNYRDNQPKVISKYYYKYPTLKAYFERVNYYFTFTSGNIINKQQLSNDFKINRFLGGNVNLLNWIFDVIFNSTYNIVIEDKLIGMKVENTGGYGFAETFGTNQNIIFDFYNQKNHSQLFKIINNSMLVTYFPWLIALVMKDNQSFTEENTDSVLRNLYSKNFRYWIFCNAFFYSNHYFSKIYFSFISVYTKTIYKPLFWVSNYFKRYRKVILKCHD